MSDFAPTASWETLQYRHRLMRTLREFFDSRGFVEVETPLLSHDTVVDRNLEPFEISPGPFRQSANPTERLWLQTSPEFGMKRLLASGAKAIYQVTRAFRREEQGQLHNPEFTIVEWYRVGDDMQAGIDLLSDLAGEVFATIKVSQTSYQAAFREHVGIDPHTSTVSQLVTIAEQLGIEPPVGFDRAGRDEWLDLLLVRLVSRPISESGPTVLYDYPASQAMLAQVRNGDPPVAERFELFFRGIELANGYHELLDPAELRERNRHVNSQRAGDGRRKLPGESRLLLAMESGLPACSGVALGFDRLLMTLLGFDDISKVMAFPFDRA